MKLLEPNTVSILCGAFLLTLLASACWNDIRNRKIPNKLVCLGAITGIVLNTLLPYGAGLFSPPPGGIGFFDALIGLLVGLSLFMPLYFVRAMGAGDVKLMAMIGAFLGPTSVFHATLMTFLAGGILAIGASLWTRTFRRMLNNVHSILTSTTINAMCGQRVHIKLPATTTTTKLPYGVAIAAGTIIQIFLSIIGHPIF